MSTKHFQIVSPPFSCGISWIVNILHELNIKTTNVNFQNTQWTSLGDNQFVINHDAQQFLKIYFPSFNEKNTFEFQESIEVFWEHRLDLAINIDRPTILVVRDPRDAIYSLYKRNYEKHLNFDDYLKRPDQWPDHFPSLFNLPPSETIAIFTLFWLEMSKFMPISIIKFEDTKSLAGEQVKKVLDFLKITRTDSEIENAIHASSFKEVKKAFDLLNTNQSSTFIAFRKGQINEWLNTYTPKQLQYISTPPIIDCYGKILNYKFSLSFSKVLTNKIQSQLNQFKIHNKLIDIANQWTNNIFSPTLTNTSIYSHFNTFFKTFLRQYQHVPAIQNLLSFNELNTPQQISQIYHFNILFFSGYFFAIHQSLGPVNLTLGTIELKNKYQDKVLYEETLPLLYKKLHKENMFKKTIKRCAAKMYKFNPETITQIRECIFHAGNLTTYFQNDISPYSIKTDSSPLTQADMASHEYLSKQLKKIINAPVLSEEEHVAYDVRRNWDYFWIIDPLDGTKEFISGYNDYCINIAFIQQKSPIFGMIYAPKLNELYIGSLDGGFEYHGPEIEIPHTNHIQIATSRFHHSEKTQKFILENNIQHSIPIGAAIKFGRLALGQIQLYPRFEGSKEWDTAAGQIIIESTGNKMYDLETQERMYYNKESIKNNFFIAYHSTINLKAFKF